MKELKKLLNSQQYEAAMHNNGPALVIAAAGTGKTRIIIYRTARMLVDGIDPSSILILTFTNKAAGAIKGRTKELTKEYNIDASKVQGGTFHGFAYSYIKSYPHFFKGMGEFKLDPNRQLLKDTCEDIRKKSYKGYLPGDSIVEKIFNKAVNSMRTIEGTIEEDYEDYIPQTNAITKAYEMYVEDKQELKYIDFNDILSIFYDKLKKDKELINYIHSQHCYIMVDEYQDTNILQDRIVSLLASNSSHNLMVIGDEGQSIYGFNGANYRNILNFPNKFPNTNVIKLNQNYRSNQEILDLANEIINNSENGAFKKELFSDKSGEKPKIRKCFNRGDEGRFIVDKIRREIALNGVEHVKNIAVLFRSSYQSVTIEALLKSLNIPFKKFGGMEYFDKAHIQDILALLSAVHRKKDYISWKRALKLVPGVGREKALKIIRHLKENNEKINGISNIFAGTKIEANLKKLEDTLTMISKDNSTQLLKKIIDSYKFFMKTKYKQNTLEKRMIELGVLRKIASQFKNLRDFSEALNSPDRDKADDKSGDYITLSTIHSAKGLEWDIVFIISATDGEFPSARSDDLSEERRLMYVATTRAKNELWITFQVADPSSPAGTQEFYSGGLSRFIREVNESLYDMIPLY